MSLLSEIIAAVAGIFPRIRIQWSRKTAVLIFRQEMDRFEVCQAKEVRRKRPFFRSDQVALAHLGYDGEFTVERLFE